MAASVDSSPAHDLEATLVAEFRAFQKLLEVAKEQRACLSEGNVERLTPLLEEEEYLLDQLSMLEERRKTLCLAIAALIPLPEPADSLEALLPHLSAERRNRLENLRGGIQALTDEGREINQQVRYLTASRLQWVKASEDFLLSLLDPVNTYGPDGALASSAEAPLSGMERRA